MSLKSKLRSQAIQALLGDRARAAQRFGAEMKRRITGSAHEISVFLQLDDPYSYLLSLYLPFVAAEYDVVLRFYLTQAVGKKFSPEPELLAEYALNDCRLLARELGVPFLDKGDTPVVEYRRGLLEELGSEHQSDEFPALLCAALAGYWRGDVEGIARMLGGQTAAGDNALALIEINQDKLVSMGHYNSAMLHYGGEWYWSVDRLPHLLQRLDELGIRRQTAPGRQLASIGQATRLTVPATTPGSAKSLPPLDFYFSFRSPYSYLAMERTIAIADAWGLTLNLRPVLPMVMRGLSVPKSKVAYIGIDAKREAQRHGITLGPWCDPLGAGVERCMAVFRYAGSQRKSRDFMLAAAAGIWSEGLDVASDKGLRTVTERVGLFWPEVVAAMADASWRAEAERNERTLVEFGAWGVPTFVFGTLALWGQDRLWLLARQIEDRCQDGEGIMV